MKAWNTPTWRCTLMLAAAWMLHSSAMALAIERPDAIFLGKTFDTAQAGGKNNLVSHFCTKGAGGCGSVAVYGGPRLVCDFPQFIADRILPDNLQQKKRFDMVVGHVPVGPKTQGQQCVFSLQIELPDFVQAFDAQMAYIDWTFEKSIPPGFVAGRREGDKRIVLPYYFVTPRNGDRSKPRNVWDGQAIDYRAMHLQSRLPARVQAPVQKSWFTVIINGVEMDKHEIHWSDEVLQFVDYDWRRKSTITHQKGVKP